MVLAVKMNEIQYIDTTQTLSGMCRELRDCEWLAVDTEFIREKTYYPRLALMQIAGAPGIYCVDPPALADLSPLFELLESDSITKVLHSGGQDLELFYLQRARLPVPIFDTQVAAALLGIGEQIGYAALVHNLLGIELDKSCTRTDWMQRPLGKAQLSYAADDVRYLAQIYPVMAAKLASLGRMDWLREDVTRLHDPKNYQPDLSSCWQRVKGAGKLKRGQLNVLKHLSAWRERQAMKSDLPRRWVLPDEALLSLAVQSPETRRQLLQTEHLDGRAAARHAEELLKMIAIAREEPEENHPPVPHSKKPTEEEDARMESLMTLVTARAEALAISPGQITSRSEIMKLIRGERTLQLLEGWRLKVAGRAVLESLATSP